MREAPVGWQCPSCVRQGARVSPQIRWRPRRGGRLGNTRLTPVTAVLIAVNVVAFIWEETDSARVQQRFEMWSNGVHFHDQWYRVITSAFLHENIEHLLLNMFTLAIVGPPLEAELGRGRFAALYLLAAGGGSVGYYLVANPDVGGLGASGAIFGVMAAYYVLAWLRRWDIQPIAGLLIVNVVFTFVTPNVAWQDHLGGLLTGALVCLGMVAEPGMISAARAGVGTRARRGGGAVRRIPPPPVGP